MTRLELLRLVIGRARSNGFEFRRWYRARLDETWVNTEVSLHVLEEHRHYYALLFSHEFARSFWKPGSEITFQVEAQTFQRRMRDGTVATVSRKPFTRRSARPDAWRFHLREMAAAEEPLRYIRKYLHVQEETSEVSSASTRGGVSRELPLPAGSIDTGALLSRSAPYGSVPPGSPPFSSKPKPRPQARPLPSEPPAFLRRPYGDEGPGSNSTP